ncbi:flagellar radial spoke protein 1-like [Salvia splendens]|uniref:flagellar radial spoke protein 1-like n=1 Tax=Salvia splendens TaxID=180675 RepID=UPI001C253E3C|nr:flagellar radial spoke protein 1-like [Salvia splendens]
MGEEAIPTGRTTASQGTHDQEQRQERLEKAVEELAEENRLARAELACLTNMMEEILKELGTGKLVREAVPSGHRGRTNEPRVSEEVVPETEEAEQKEEAEQEESEEEPSGNEEEDLKEPPAPVPAPRRSRRNP